MKFIIVGLLLISLLMTNCEVVSDPCPQDFAYVPAGWFWMGQNDGRNSNMPAHRVYLDAYCIQRLEVTHQEFSKFITYTNYKSQGWTSYLLAQGPDLPMNYTLWADADAYCRWAGWRLPSEAEWEKAARSDDGRTYPWGQEWDPSKANTAESGHSNLVPVGSYPDGASPYGLQDMSGNAAEWVADHFDFDYYNISPDHNPTGPTQILDHGLRGGSYASDKGQATTYFRDSSHSALPNPRAGFRCVISP